MATTPGWPTPTRSRHQRQASRRRPRSSRKAASRARAATRTQIGAFFYGGSGTPISTQVVGQDQYAPLVNGRGDMGRTPILTRTDLLLSHELSLADRKRLRLELNVQNIFNQKTATHIFNYLNKGAPAGGSTRPANAIDFSEVNLAAGYDYNALIRATQEGELAFDP